MTEEVAFKPMSPDTIESIHAREQVDFLESVGVRVYEKDMPDDALKEPGMEEIFWKGIGVVPETASDVSRRSLTREVFPNEKMWGDWCRGGAESYYQVSAVSFTDESGNRQERLVAAKAIHSMGGGGTMKSMAIGEAVRLSLLRKTGNAGQIYAVAGATLYKEWLTPDTNIDAEQTHAALAEMKMLLDRLGIEISTGISGEVIIVNGKPCLVDGGSGDLAGPKKLPASH